MKKQDFIVIAALLCVAAVIFAALHFGTNKGTYVQIQVDNKVVDTLPLNENTEKVIKTDNGSNTLLIQDGYACITQADCPDKICVHHRKISQNGESVICLPHKLVISIVNERDSDEIDI